MRPPIYRLTIYQLKEKLHSVYPFLSHTQFFNEIHHTLLLKHTKRLISIALLVLWFDQF